MRYKVTLAPSAASDLASLRWWLKQPGAGVRATRRLDHIAEALRDISQHPLRWPVGEQPNVRERPVAGYCIAYRIDSQRANSVRVLRIFGPYQDRTGL